MILVDAIRPQANANPADDRWYQPSLGLATQSDTGIPISADTIFLCDVVLAAVRFKADAVSVCTPQMFRRSGPNREQVSDHAALRVLRNPNDWQTGYEWTHLNVTRMSTWGNAYNRIIAGDRYFAQQLWPMHPSRVRIVDQRSDGGLVYTYRDPTTNQELRLQQEEVLHYKGISIDGFSGLAIYQVIRNAVGISLAAEKHTSLFFKRGTRLSGILSTQSALTKDVRDRTVESWNRAFGGVNAEQAGGVALVGDGLKFDAMAVDHQKGQFLELGNQLVEKILRHLGVPGVVVGYQGDKASTYASAEAFFEKGGIKHCILPLVMSMEQRDDKMLLLGDEALFTKRNLGVLERANTQDSFKTLIAAAGRPIITGNEARAWLDMNRDEDPSMDRVLMATNMSTGGGDGQPGAPGTSAPPSPLDDTVPSSPPSVAAPAPTVADRAALAERLIQRNAARSVRREVAALKDKAPKYARNPEGWKAWVAEYYGAHAAHLMDALDLDEQTAAAYCERQKAAVLEGGIAAMESWEADVVPQLAALALGPEGASHV